MVVLHFQFLLQIWNILFQSQILLKISFAIKLKMIFNGLFYFNIFFDFVLQMSSFCKRDFDFDTPINVIIFSNWPCIRGKNHFTFEEIEVNRNWIWLKCPSLLLLNFPCSTWKEIDSGGARVRKPLSTRVMIFFLSFFFERVE